VERRHDVSTYDDQSNDGRLNVDEAKRQVDQRRGHQQRVTGQLDEHPQLLTPAHTAQLRYVTARSFTARYQAHALSFPSAT